MVAQLSPSVTCPDVIEIVTIFVVIRVQPFDSLY